MAEQFSLPGFEWRLPTDRLFFALLLDTAINARLAQIARHLSDKFRLAGQMVLPRHYHITLYHLGDYLGRAEGVVAKAMSAGQGVSELPFYVAFDRAGSWPGRENHHPLVLGRGKDNGFAALTAFRQALGTEMKKVGLRRWAKQHHTPHVTLLYGKFCPEIQLIEAIGWTVQEFVLVRSLLGQTEHEVLDRWSLRGRPSPN